MSHHPAPLTLRRHPTEVGRARGHVHRLCSNLSRHTRELIVLLTSEVVTNAVQHGLGPITLQLIPKDGTIRVEVSDAGPGLPEIRHPTSAQGSGRGMLIVDSLATAWGIRHHAPRQGKTVWFTVAAE